jgi:signal transduction histidine kinase
VVIAPGPAGPRPAGVATVLVAGLAAGLAVVLAADALVPVPLLAAATVLPAWALSAAALLLPPGTAAPAVRVLLHALAATWVLSLVPVPGDPVSQTLAALLGGLWPAVLAQLVLSLPEGRPPGRAGRTALVGAYVLTGPGNVAAQLGGGPAVQVVVGTGQVVFGVALVVLVGRRLRSLPPVVRRSYGPVLASGGLVVASLVALRVAQALRDGPAAPAELRPGWLQVAYGAALALLPLGLAVAGTAARLDRARVADLATALDGPLTGEELRAAIARALQDPSLEVLYWRPAAGHHVDAAGVPRAVPDDPARAVTPIGRDGAPIALLVHAAGPASRAPLVRAVAAAARLALENEQLRSDLAARLVEVRASRARLLVAGDTARRRLERDLHDGAQQRFVNATVLLALARRHVPAPGRAADAVAAAGDELRRGLDELRELARGLHPAILSGAGLGPALEALAERCAVPVALRVDLPHRLPTPVEDAAYYVVSEALANATKHAAAAAVRVEAGTADGALRLVVADDGTGGADPERGSGLRGLRDRVEALDGRLDVVSPVGGGTRVEAVVPCAS